MLSTPLHRKRRRRNNCNSGADAAACVLLALAIIACVAATPLESLSAQISRSGQILGRIPPQTQQQQALPSASLSRRLLQTGTGSADGTHEVSQQQFAQAAFTLIERSQGDAEISQQAIVGEFSDTFWTLPGDAVSTAAHWIQIDIDVDPAVLQGEDVLQLWQGIPTLRGALIKQWTGKLLQPAEIASENAQRASGDFVLEDHPDEQEVGPEPEHHIRGAPHEHIDLWAPSATLRYHRNTTAANAASAALLFTARWSLSPRCPDGLDPSPDGGCATPPTRLQNSPWLLAIIGVPGLLFIGFVLFMMAPHSWRTCPRACCCLPSRSRRDEKNKQARDAEGKQIEQDWADSKHRNKPESLVEMGRRHKASVRALALGGAGGAAAAKKATANKHVGSSTDPSPDAGAVHPDRSPKVTREDDASPSSLPEPWVVLHGAPEEFLTGAAAARAIRGADGTAVTREPSSSERSDRKQRSAADGHLKHGDNKQGHEHDADDADGSSSSKEEPWKILRGGPEPFLTGHAAAKAIRGTEGTNITREPSPSPPPQEEQPREDDKGRHNQREHREHRHRDRSPDEHDDRSSADPHHASNRDTSPSVGEHHQSDHTHEQRENVVRAKHHASHHPHGDADKDEQREHREHHHHSHHEHRSSHHHHSEHRHHGREHDDARHSEREADRKEHQHRDHGHDAEDKKSHDQDKHSNHEAKSKRLSSAPSSSIGSVDIDVHGPHAVHQMQQHKIDKKAEMDAHDPHLSPKDTAGDDVQNSNTTEHPAAEGGSIRSKVDALSGIGPAEHEWSRRLKRELQRTIPVFFFELAGTSVNWVFAVQYINTAAKDKDGIIGDQLAMAYLSFGVLATIGAFINGWSRVVVIRELFCELYAAQHMPLSHSAYNSRNVAPGIEIAFLERHIHHLKVVGLTLLVESLPFAMLGFSKLYRFNAVQSNLLLLVSCGLSAFWVGSKLTRLITIPELLSHIHRLEAEEREEAGARRAAQAKRERKERLPGAKVEQKLTALVNAVLNIDEEAEDRERDAAWEKKEKEAQQRLAEKHQQDQTHARAQGKHRSHDHQPAPSPSPSHSCSHSGSRGGSDDSNAVDVPGDGMVAKRAVASPKSKSRSRSRSHSRSASASPSRSPRDSASPSRSHAQPHFHEASVQ